mgnify:CR=1 FL=1
MSLELGPCLLEDVVEAQKVNAKFIHWSLKNAEGTADETRWLLKIRPMIYKNLSILCVVLSLFCFLGVIGSMTPDSIVASIYYWMVHSRS